MKFHDTWSFECFHFPEIPWYVKYQGLKHHWNSTVHEITDVEIVAKLPDTRKLQHVYCPKFDDTFNFHAWYWKRWYRLFTPLIRHDMFPTEFLLNQQSAWSALHFITFQGLICGVAVLYLKWFLAVPTILPFLSPPQSYSLQLIAQRMREKHTF